MHIWSLSTKLLKISYCICIKLIKTEMLLSSSVEFSKSVVNAAAKWMFSKCTKCTKLKVFKNHKFLFDLFLVLLI